MKRLNRNELRYAGSQFIISGRARYVVDGQEFEAGGGEILVIKAGEVHQFSVISDDPLVQVDVHMSPDSSRRT